MATHNSVKDTGGSFSYHNVSTYQSWDMWEYSSYCWAVTALGVLRCLFGVLRWEGRYHEALVASDSN